MSTDRANAVGQKSIALLEKADDALSTDFCPWANKYVYWLKNPFWVLVLAVAGSVLCGVFLNPMIFVLTGLLLVITASGVLLPQFAVRGIQCRVTFDIPRSRVGQPALVRLIITNKWPLPVWGLSLINGFARDTSIDGNEGVALARVPGWSTAEYSWPFEPAHRGLYPDGTATVETGFPFGLYRAAKSADVEGQLIVWPETVQLDGVPDASESQHSEDQFSDRRVGDFGDMMGARPFRQGDSLRRVHWGQTARQQTLIVTERQAPAMTSIRVVLDVHEENYSSSEEFELAVSAAASICESLHQQHCRIELALGSEVFVAGDGAAGFLRLMDALASVEVSATPLRGTSIRQSFEIHVTANSTMPSTHPHVVLVGNESAWIALESADEMTDAFPAAWRRVCHGR